MIKELLTQAKVRLRQSNLNEVDAEILLSNQLGIARMDLHNPIKLEAALANLDVENLSELFNTDIARRISGEPVQYITGCAYFRDLELAVGPGVLIPRPETEALVSYVLSQIEDLNHEISLIDLGSGSGAIAIALAIENNRIRAIAVEKSEAALYWLKENVAKYQPDMRVIYGDIATALEGIKCDVVVANPPYVPDGIQLPADVINHEPHDSLFGGPTGLEIPTNFIKAAVRLLKPGGLFVMEHAEEHGEGVKNLLEGEFESIQLHYDLNKRPRFTSARRKR